MHASRIRCGCVSTCLRTISGMAHANEHCWGQAQEHIAPVGRLQRDEARGKISSSTCKRSHVQPCGLAARRFATKDRRERRSYARVAAVLCAARWVGQPPAALRGEWRTRQLPAKPSRALIQTRSIGARLEQEPVRHQQEEPGRNAQIFSPLQAVSPSEPWQAPKKNRWVLPKGFRGQTWRRKNAREKIKIN